MIPEENDMSRLEEEIYQTKIKGESSIAARRLHFSEVETSMKPTPIVPLPLENPRNHSERETPTEKQMENYVTKVWDFVTKPKVLMHDDGYFIFKFNLIVDKEWATSRLKALERWLVQ
ncbi:hypothetical protein BC332_03252 [Capsicum chinense]|nr:hypothetical protein BC332_03252 [Capsicum chinense]